MNIKSISIGRVTIGIPTIVADHLVSIWPELARWIIGMFFVIWGVLVYKQKVEPILLETVDYQEKGGLFICYR